MQYNYPLKNGETTYPGWGPLEGLSLLVGSQPASLDLVLERLATCSAILPLRYLDATEKPEALPAWLRTMTMEEQKRSFLDRLQQGIKTNREQAESACRSRQDGAILWATLQGRLDQFRDAAARLEQLNQQSTQLAAAIEQEADAAHPIRRLPPS